jgi:hypothetical protein
MFMGRENEGRKNGGKIPQGYLAEKRVKIAHRINIQYRVRTPKKIVFIF